MILPTPESDEIRQVLIGKPEDEYGQSYQNHVLEIYKLYVQMADEVSVRRQTANSFYVTINAALVAAIAHISTLRSHEWDYGIIAVAGIAVCWMWLRNIASYKSLNAGKFYIVNEIENFLPLRPYHAEWERLKRGTEKSTHIPFHAVEKWVPVAFIIVHLFILSTAVLRTLP